MGIKGEGLDGRAPSMSHMQAPTGATRDGGKSDDERPSQITARQEKEAMSLRVSRMTRLYVRLMTLPRWVAYVAAGYSVACVAAYTLFGVGQ